MRITPEIDRNHSGASAWWVLCLDGPASPLSAASLSVLSPLSQPSLQPLWKSRDKRGTNHNVPARTSSRETFSCVWKTEQCIWAVWKMSIPFSVITLIKFMLASSSNSIDCGSDVFVCFTGRNSRFEIPSICWCLQYWCHSWSHSMRPEDYSGHKVCSAQISCY